jgi:hypothetical protein
MHLKGRTRQTGCARPDLAEGLVPPGHFRTELAARGKSKGTENCPEEIFWDLAGENNSVLGFRLYWPQERNQQRPSPPGSSK